MTNRDLEASWTYHNSTKHSYWSIRTGQHSLDWANYPRPFKIYPTLKAMPLPREVPQSGMAALSMITEPGRAPEGEAVPNLAELAALLYFSGGITRRKTHPGGEIFFRAAACTGALYEIELYVVCGDQSGLPAGVYHFGPADFSLRRLRTGDYRGVLAQATADEPHVRHAPLVVISTGTYWRNAWKYQARTYRHFGWDNGTILANLLALCAAWRLPAHVLVGFLDAKVNQLLDLDTRREVALSLVPIGQVSETPPEPPEIVPLELETIPASERERDYPSMRAMHEASSLPSFLEVAAWRRAAAPRVARAARGNCIPLQPLSDTEVPREPIEQVILRRGSSRKFAREPISFGQFSTLLERATRGLPADFLVPATLLNDLYVIVHAVEGLRPGSYFYHPGQGLLERLREGRLRVQASYLGLEQELPGDASATMFFLADLQSVLERAGNRGYRAVQLEAGILGGKLYLAAYAQGLGATGLTFYDDEVTDFFSPHAKGKSAIFLMAVGRRALRA